MGITVLSNTAAAIAASPGELPATSIPTALTGPDFSALLAQQVLGEPITTGMPGTVALLGKGATNNNGIGALPPGLSQLKDNTTKEKKAADALLQAAEPNADLAAAWLATPPAAPAALQTKSETEASLSDLLAGSRGPSAVAQQIPSGTLGDEGKRLSEAFAQMTPARSLESANFAASAGTQTLNTESSPVPEAPFATALAAQQAAFAAQRPEQSIETPPVSARVGSPEWGAGVGDSVVWMSRQEVQSAQINLNPPHLGPLQISLSLSGDQATASFVSPHAEVRQAIQDALPHLREMLAGAGINLGDANIGAQLQQQHQTPNPQASPTARFANDNAILQGAAGELHGSSSPVRGGRGLVDLFA